MKKFALTVFTLLILFINITAFAQDDTPIKYGETASGEITNRKFEIPYVFQGDAHDVIVVEMKPVDTLGTLHSPEIILLNSDGDVLADTSSNFSIGEALLVFELDAKSEYSILATRQSGRAGDSTGEFTLKLIKPTLLEDGTPLEEKISTKQGDNYYTIRSDSPSLDLTYQKTDGDFAPQISINRISDTHGLKEVASLSGDELERGQLNVPSDKGVYIVKLGTALFDFHFNEVTANYRLELVKST